MGKPGQVGVTGRPDALEMWAREEQKRKEIAYTGAYVSVDPHENAFNPDGTVNTERRFEKGRVYPEFLKWQPSLDRRTVGARRRRAGHVRGGEATHQSKKQKQTKKIKMEHIDSVCRKLKKKIKS